MKRFVLCGFSVLLVALAAAYMLGLLSFGTLSGTCAIDGEIPQSNRENIESVAKEFVHFVVNGEADRAYADMTAEAKQSTALDKLKSLDNQFIQPMKPYSNVNVEHIYYLQTKGGGNEGKAICGPVSGDQWVSVSVKPGIAQAHVVILADTRNNQMAFTFWLIPEHGTWRIQYFNLTTARIVKLGPRDFLEMARKQRDLGHAFDATMLYAGLQATMGRGPTFQLGIVQTAQNDLKTFRAPPELRGEPPFRWKLNGDIYKVSQVTIGGVDKKLGLIFQLPQERWDGDGAADAANRHFLDAFIATHPDYSQVFGFLVARAMKPDNSGGFGTVYEVGKGYLVR